MQPFRRLLRKRVIFAFVDGAIILFILLLLWVSRSSAGSSSVISYLKTPGHVLVQLAELPERAEAERHTMPEWSLYGDGTLLFQGDLHEDLWRAHLAPEAIQQILDVIVNRDQFFSSSAPQYGGGSDDDKQRLMVEANGEQKAVMLTSEPATGGARDIQTRHVFAIEQFLLSYRPLPATWYAPDADPDDMNGT